MDHIWRCLEFTPGSEFGGPNMVLGMETQVYCLQGKHPAHLVLVFLHISKLLALSYLSSPFIETFNLNIKCLLKHLGPEKQ